MLQLKDIHKSFGSQKILSGISLEVRAGEVLGLLGHNGAGKTTLLRIATLLLPPDSGSVLFDGHPLAFSDMPSIGYLPEERGLYRNMRAGEQAVYMAMLKGLSRKQAAASATEWFSRLGMADWWNRPTSHLSKGMQQRLQFVVSVVHHPRLLILDEPFSGFDDANAAMLTAEIARLQNLGLAILLSTHNHTAASTLCTHTVSL